VDCWNAQRAWAHGPIGKRSTRSAIVKRADCKPSAGKIAQSLILILPGDLAGLKKQLDDRVDRNASDPCRAPDTLPVNQAPEDRYPLLSTLKYDASVYG
jgi:hypothetical protein